MRVDGAGDAGDAAIDAIVDALPDTTTDTSPVDAVDTKPPVDVTDTMPVDAEPDVIDAAPDVEPDVAPDVAPDVTMDVPILPDVVDVPPPDVAMDVPPAMCTGAIDLNTAGTMSGSTTSYTGDNLTVPEPAMYLPMACTTNTGAQVIFTYTMHDTAVLRVSTVDPGTDFDTVALAISACSSSATELGCNDDFGASGRQSQFDTASIPAGTTVVVIVGGYTTTTERGNFVLHVTEVPEIAVGGTCDPTGAANVCATGASCLTSGGSSTCIADGSLGGRCRSSGTACDAGSGCNGSVFNTSSRCVPVVPDGSTCDSATTFPTNVCDPTEPAHCITSGGVSTCVADGTLGGRCRTTGTACDPGAGCNGSVTSTSSRCVPVVPDGGTCDPATTLPTNVCDPTEPAHCITSGGSSTCIADGALGGRCRSTGTACDTPNGCNGSVTSTASRCVPIVPLGGTCDPTRATNICTAGSSCTTSGGTSTCTALPTESTTAPMCDDLSTVGTVLTAVTGDDAVSAILALPSGFAFSYFGTPVDHFSASTNGFAQLWAGTTGAPATAFSNVVIPSTATPNGVVAPFWDDLRVPATGSVRTATFGTAPDRRFVIEWNAAQLFGDSTSVLTFQVKLFETSNVIEFHYCTLTPASNPNTSGAGATVGIESLTGAAGVQHSNNTAGSVTTATAIRYTP